MRPLAAEEPGAGPGDATSDVTDPAQAFDRLHPEVQRWVWTQGWDRLRTIQAQAVDPLLGGHDLVIAAATASGKTEAAWLPIFSMLAEWNGSASPGVRALYLGPLKALINDQHRRLTSLGASTGIDVHRWHGDVASSQKRAVLRRPDGVLLITPESLEALFVREGHRVVTIFAGLRYIVVDELHSFIGTERGAQLQSLMHRVDLAVRRRVPRVGLSATLADLRGAADFLRPSHGDQVRLLDNPGGETAEIKLQLRGYVKTQPTGPPTDLDSPADRRAVDVALTASAASAARAASAASAAGAEDEADDAADADVRTIAHHLFSTLRGQDNLVFANSRRSVESYADVLAKLCEEQRVPNEFFPHHGNLSKEYREDVERRLGTSDLPTTAVCTSTLEMGIDIGSTDSVAQIGAPGSVAALRQRLGRSGRRDQPAVMRLYISEDDVTEQTPPPDQLRVELVQTVAMVNLMLRERWYEPPNTADLHLSTLVQQVLSVVAQHGGASAAQLYSSLCGDGPFRGITPREFSELLSSMGQRDLIIQASDGLLLHGKLGDTIVNHYTFYSAFHSAEEYRLVANGRTLGSIPVDYPLLVGNLLIFAGRRWKVVDVDTRSRVIELSRSGGGRPPAFAGGGADVADLVRQRMREIYESSVVPAYLDRPAQLLLDEGRTSYRRLGLHRRHVLGWGADTLLFPWRGDRVMNTILVMLTDAGLEVAQDGVALTIHGATVDEVLASVRVVLTRGVPEAAELAAEVNNKERQKYDRFLSSRLQAVGYASFALDVDGAWNALRDVCDHADTPSRDGTPS